MDFKLPPHSDISHRAIEAHEPQKTEDSATEKSELEVDIFHDAPTTLQWHINQQETDAAQNIQQYRTEFPFLENTYRFIQGAKGSKVSDYDADNIEIIYETRAQLQKEIKSAITKVNHQLWNLESQTNSNESAMAQLLAQMRSDSKEELLKKLSLLEELQSRLANLVIPAGKEQQTRYRQAQYGINHFFQFQKLDKAASVHSKPTIGEKIGEWINRWVLVKNPKQEIELANLRKTQEQIVDDSFRQFTLQRSTEHPQEIIFIKNGNAEGLHPGQSSSH